VVEFGSVKGQPGTTPVSRALPRAFAWSTILGSRTRVGRPSVDRRASWHLDVVIEHATACPSSERITRVRVGVRLARPAGLVVTVDSPMRRPHHPRSSCSFRVNSAAEVKLTVPCRLLSLTRSYFQPVTRPTAVVVGRHFVGFPRFRRPRVGHPSDGRPDTWFLSQGRSEPLGFVSYNSLVSTEVGLLRGSQ
jgi:hypothetical protein